MLCNAFPEHENWISWYSAAVLHSEFFMKRGSRIAAPYDLLPNSVWKETELEEVKDDTVQRRYDAPVSMTGPAEQGLCSQDFPHLSRRSVPWKYKYSYVVYLGPG